MHCIVIVRHHHSDHTQACPDQSAGHEVLCVVVWSPVRELHGLRLCALEAGLSASEGD